MGKLTQRRRKRKKLLPDIEFWFFRNRAWERFLIPRKSQVVIDERTVFRETPD